MFGQQPITHPLGITVFGSATIRIDPDIASLSFAVYRTDKRPKDALRQAREAAKGVQNYLAKMEQEDYGSSQIELDEKFEHDGRKRVFVGYTAKIEFHLILRDLDQTEEILIGITDAGVNSIDSVDYQTSRLKELRAEARKKAVAAAKEKAELYCEAAGVSLGSVIHIEDTNPDQLRRRESHSLSEEPMDDDGPVQAFNPSSIVVGGAVRIAYTIGS